MDKLYIAILHPTTESLHINISGIEIDVANVSKSHPHITMVEAYTKTSGTAIVTLKAGSDTALNLAYIVIEH